MMTYLITGAAGSLGSVLVEKLLADGNNTVRAFDSDEYGLSALPKGMNPRKILGSVANKDEITRAIRGADIVIHCAAVKNLDISEYNVHSLIDTNVTGTYNVAMACQEHKVKTAVYISTDKVTGVSTYGVTKLLGEKVWFWAHRTSPSTRFVTMRSGNFCSSRGNVFEVWQRQIYKGKKPTITDPEMRRFFIKTERVADLILDIVAQYEKYPRGTVVIPKMKEYNILDLFKRFYPHVDYDVTGIREGEVLGEELLCRLDNVIYEYEDAVVVKP